MLVGIHTNADGSWLLTADDGSTQAVVAGADLEAAIAAFSPPTLAEAQAAALAAVQAAKDSALGSMQYTVGGTAYAVTLTVQDQMDVQTQVALLQAQGSGATCIWEIVDNVFLTWSVADLQALQSAGIAHVQATYANAASLVAQINAATTAAGVEAVNALTGWPT